MNTPEEITVKLRRTGPDNYVDGYTVWEIVGTDSTVSVHDESLEAAVEHGLDQPIIVWTQIRYDGEGLPYAELYSDAGELLQASIAREEARLLSQTTKWRLDGPDASRWEQVWPS